MDAGDREVEDVCWSIEDPAPAFAEQCEQRVARARMGRAVVECLCDVSSCWRSSGDALRC
jgi:hypothetical protein